jgi:hypothetical protein
MADKYKQPALLKDTKTDQWIDREIMPERGMELPGT